MKKPQLILSSKLMMVVMLSISLLTTGVKAEKVKMQITEQKEEHSLEHYDEALALQLGGDEYGMRSYVMVILTTGPNDEKITDKAERKLLFSGHFENMARLANDGKLVLAGPFIDGKPKRGLLMLNVSSLEEAETLVKTDPTVKAGVFVYELTKYYGSAALMQVNEVHKKIQKKAI